MPSLGSLDLFITDIPRVAKSFTHLRKVLSTKLFQVRVSSAPSWADISPSVLILVSNKISASSGVSGMESGSISKTTPVLSFSSLSLPLDSTCIKIFFFFSFFSEEDNGSTASKLG